MGFREGEGLGKYGQGRQEIVETSKQKGRRGLGLTLKGFDGELNVRWQDEPEVSMCTFTLPSPFPFSEHVTSPVSIISILPFGYNN